MNEYLLLAVVFSAVWIVTFFPAWSLLGKLLAMSVSSTPLTLRFFGMLFLYRVIIAAPYVAVLLLGQDVLPDIISSLVVGLLVVGVLLSLVRFIFAKHIISGLWWIYGFVYDGLLVYAPYQRLTKKMVETAITEKPSAKYIIELGCGTGNVITLLKQSYPDAHIVGVDSSKSMLHVANKKHQNTEFVLQDIIGFLSTHNEGVCDLVIMQNSLYVVSERNDLWQELFRVMSPDGIIVITNSDKTGSWSITKEHLQYGKWYQLLSPKLLLVGVIDSFISKLSVAGSFSFVAEETIRNEVAELFTMSSTQRVYGDVNILFTLRKKS